MLQELKDILARSEATVMADAVGVIALFVLLFAGLSLSGAA